MRRFLILFVLLPLAVVAIALSVANRGAVTVSIDPFGVLSPAWTLSAPLFVFLFAAVGIGVIIGGVAAWSRQSKWRQAARRERANAERLRREVERLRDRVIATPTIALPRHDRDAA